MDIQLLLDMMAFDSTSGSEAEVSQFLEKRLAEPVCGVVPEVQAWDVPEGGRNLLFSWGAPRVVFCSHMDTVPPYIAPRVEGSRIQGRGGCDAKGQIFALYSACCQLVMEGLDGFGLLLVSGEETGSWGAKAFAKTDFRAPYLVIGEPTENRMVSASKGTKAFELSFRGEAFHSGYPQFGRSAVDSFLDFVNGLRAVDFGEDPLLGPTTWNIGKLSSDNPQNVLSPLLSCRLYFRTTFVSDGRAAVEVRRLAEGKDLTVKEIGGDTPAEYFTVPGIPSGPVSFGSDAPHLSNFEHRAICGPGSIRFAHREDEHILVPDLEKAVEQYVAIFKAVR